MKNVISRMAKRSYRYQKSKWLPRRRSELNIITFNTEAAIAKAQMEKRRREGN